MKQTFLKTPVWMPSGHHCMTRKIGSTTPIYSNLLTLVRALLALPASNVDSERCFSMVRKIDSEDRSHLDRSTVAALLLMKINADDDCFDFKPPEELALSLSQRLANLSSFCSAVSSALLCRSRSRLFRSFSCLLASL